VDRLFVLTNDDGIDAPGIDALREAVSGLGRSITVAPAGPQSGCGHAVTTHHPIFHNHRDLGQIAVEGTPADCVRLALHRLAPRADWFLSGINAGGNLGVDVYHSGTVAGAREAVLHGRPALAVSQYIAKGRPIDWTASSALARIAINAVLTRPWEPGLIWNINLPHPAPGAPEPEVVFCDLDPSPLPLAFDWSGSLATYSGVYQDRARRPGLDVDVCFSGRIAISALRVGHPG
jgi:5'-nucleotidase